MIRSNGGWDEWSMLLVEKYPCIEKNESLVRERYWIDNFKSQLNVIIPSRTHKEWENDNKEIISEKNKEWRNDHKEEIIEKTKEYRNNNKEKLNKKSKEYYKKNKK